jgi:hypothetical protein
MKGKGEGIRCLLFFSLLLQKRGEKRDERRRESSAPAGRYDLFHTLHVEVFVTKIVKEERE